MKQFKHFLNERRFEADNIISVLKHSFYIKDGKSVDLTTSEDFIAYLKENYNIKEIGEGMFSIAVISGNTDNPEYILKYHHMKNEEIIYNEISDKWFDYAFKINKEKPKTSLVPKILYAGFPLINDKTVGIGILEYLDLSNNENLIMRKIYFKYKHDKLFLKFLNEYNNRINLDSVFNILYTVFENNIHNYIIDMFKRFKINLDLEKEYEQKFIEFFKFIAVYVFNTTEDDLRIFIDLISDDEYRLGDDIHVGNMGFRKNGQAVIFDPAS